MAANLALILQYQGRYDPMVAAELQQLVAAIQQWANGQSAAGRWVSIAVADGVAFSTDTGTWTVPAGSVLLLSYSLTGTTLLIRFYIGLCAVTGPPNRLYVTLPLPFTVVNVADGLPKGYLHGVTGVNVNRCIILQDLDVYANGIVVVNTDKAGVTLVCETLAAGTISGTGFAGIVGQVACEVTPNA